MFLIYFKSLKILLIKNKIIIFIFLLAIFGGLFWNHRFYFKPLPVGNDQSIYICLAHDILTYQRYTECGRESYIEPGYPLFLASIFYVFDYNPDSVRFIQLFLFALTSILIYSLGVKLFDQRTGLLAGIIAAATWLFSNYTGFLLREILLVFLITVCVHFLYLASSKIYNKYFFITGIILGLITLTNSIIQYFIFFIIFNFIILLQHKISWQQLFMKLSLFILGFIIVLTPWSIRNKIHNYPSRTGYMLTIRTELMEKLYPNMYKYFFGHMFGYYFAENIFPDLNIRAFRELNGVDTIMGNLLKNGYSLKEADDILTRKAIHHIIIHPHKYLLMSLLDFINFNSPLIPQRIFDGNVYIHYTFAEGRFQQIPAVFKTSMLLSVRFIWYVFLFLIVYVFFQYRKDWERISWLFLIILYFNAVYSAVHSLPRYAVQIYPFYIILATAGACMLYNKFYIFKINIHK